MKTSIILLCLSIGFSSCGKLRTTRIGALIAKGTAGLEEPKAGNLSKTELPIALRICSALMVKRQFLATTIGGDAPKRIAYNFSYETRDCKNKMTDSKNITAEIVAVGTDLEYNSAETKNNFPDVVTDKTTAIAHVCAAITLAEPKLEEKVIKNSEVLLNKIYFVKFSTDTSGFDMVQINTKIANDKNGYDALDTQLLSFYTLPAQVSDVRNVGVEKERSQYVTCIGNEFTTKKEVFVRSVFL